MIMVIRISMRVPWKTLPCMALLLFSCSICIAQDDTSTTPAAPPPEQEDCDGIYVAYDFQGREKTYPHVKNVSAQAWSFKAMASVVNAGSVELKSWQIFIGFQHNELLVSTDGAVVVNADGFPVKAGNNGTVLAGFPQADLKTAIDTAGDFTQMAVQVNMIGTQFGVGPSGTPMPKTIKLVNDGYKCPAPKRQSSHMSACCVRDPKFKENKTKTTFLRRQDGDLIFMYDILQAFDSRYLAQVTIDNNHALGRLDQWNLTWEWMRNEFINNMKGAYTRKKEASECIYGPQGQFYKDMDFSTVMNCQRKPVIADLPPEKENDEKVGKLPYCCKNGTLLPKIMNETKARAIFQLEVMKLPPDLNRTALTPPQNWKIEGILNPTYRCGPPIRVDPTEFPDSTGVPATSSALASFQVVCNITSPKPKQNKCCVTFSAYYSDAAIPCETCACGCDNDSGCDQNAAALHIPPDALLVPFTNRTEKIKAWYKLKHQNKKPPAKLPCGDNCGVSINWHVDSDHRAGWSARVTIFNWDEMNFPQWFAAVELKKAAIGYEKVYSFNGTMLTNPNNTIFMQGLKGLDFLIGEVNGSNPIKDPRVPGKVQTVISFNKKDTPRMNIPNGDGFPSKLLFNGEECALPKQFPTRSGGQKSHVGLLPALLLALVTFLLLTDHWN